MVGLFYLAVALGILKAEPSNDFGGGAGLVIAGGVFLVVGAVRLYLRADRTLGAATVEFGSRTGRPGDALSVRVRFVPRRASVLKKGTARLVGREKAGGEGTHTHLLHEETVVLDPGRRLQPDEPVELTGALRIPPRAPYSFAAPNNSVEWYVEIRLAVRGRLRWVRQYPIAVVPEAASWHRGAALEEARAAAQPEGEVVGQPARALRPRSLGCLLKETWACFARHRVGFYVVGPLLLVGLFVWQAPGWRKNAEWERRMGVAWDAARTRAGAEAEEQYLAALREAEGFGAEDPRLAKTLDRLAGLYQNQGRYAEAEPLYQRALAIQERALGPDHPETGFTVNGLALLYQRQGRYAEAEPLLQRALSIAERTRGPDHRDTGRAAHNLAQVLRQQGRHAEAEPLYQRALSISERALGSDHNDVTDALESLADLYHDLARYDEAEALLQRALATLKAAFGPDHRDVVRAVNNLAELRQAQGRFAEAAEALEGHAALLREMDRAREADALADRAAAIRARLAAGSAGQ